MGFATAEREGEEKENKTKQKTTLIIVFCRLFF
jgi:hypothetical protein